ncbi:DUF4350 domain-containing protein [Leucothrix pacifica]|uniref:DUF4350 domain-containing protein n=1 Tax=Leucothrix pacifica TaxID=1247513 RepID=A0A317CHZ2_9GAMM|nr:DUF4350 domain-containing protein [Leucothrix pacifica]PWQ98178.1 hypothetical protein DKW60_08690 [Leucothrix pacifica]
MNTQLRQGLIAAAVAVGIGLVLWAISLNFEYKEEKDWRPLTGEARQNPLYASRLFLKGMGIPTETLESLQSLSSLPDTDTVIVIDTSRYTQRQQQFDEIITWVESGGHLISRGVSDWEFFDPERAEDAFEESDNGSKISSDPLQRYLKVHTGESIPFKQKDYTEIQLTDAGKTLKVGSDYFQSLLLDSDNEQIGLTQIKINNENFIIQQKAGQGLITLVSDLSFIENYSIDDYDHAELFWYLVHANTSSPIKAVWLIHSDEMPNLFKIIWQHFWALCIMLAVLFAAWVLRVSRRFGPMIPKDDEDRRNLMEHIDASGNYYWQLKQQSMLVNSTRAAVQQRLIQRIPGWQAMNNDQQAMLLAERLSIKEQHVLKLLHGDISHNPHEFTEVIKQLEQIRTTV